MSSCLKLTILFLGARRRINFIKKLQKQAEEKDYAVDIYTADTDDLDPIARLDWPFLLVPNCREDGYIDRLLEVCLASEVNLVIPWNDAEIQIINEHRAKFLAAGIRVLLPPESTTRLFLDKFAFSDWCSSEGLLTPEQYLPPSANFPCVVKPRFGQGSVGVTTCTDSVDLAYAIKLAKQPLIQKFIEGPEYTVDVFCWPPGQVFTAVPRRRIKTRGGEVLIAKVEKDHHYLEIAMKLCALNPFVGIFNFQYIRNGQDAFLIEANPRFGGGTDLSIASGADFPTYILEFFLFDKILSSSPVIDDKMTMTRYHEAVFYVEDEFPAAMTTLPGAMQ
ncbi:ATP-grasp domain-containing protein [Polaromonas sp. P5_D5]